MSTTSTCPAENTHYANYTYLNEDDIPDCFKCNICLEPLVDPHMSTMECKHYFCGECLKSWLKQKGNNKTCPKCRTEVRKNPIRVQDEEVLATLESLCMKCDTCDHMLPRFEVPAHDANCEGVSTVTPDQMFSIIEKCTKEWYDNLSELIPELEDLAKVFDLHHRNVKIAQLTGTSASLIGTALVVGGFIGSFFTFGVSLGLSVAGGAMGVAGAATAAGASVTEWGIVKQKMKKIQSKIVADVKLRNKIKYWLEHLSDAEEVNDYLEKKVTSMIDGETTLFSVLKAIQNEFDGDNSDDGTATKGDTYVKSTQLFAKSSTASAQLAKIGTGALIKTASSLGRVVSIAGVVLSVATIPLDVYCLVQDSKDVHFKKTSEKSSEIKELSRSLKARREVLLNKLDQDNETFEML